MVQLIQIGLLVAVMLVSYHNGGWAEVGQTILIGLWIAVAMSRVCQKKMFR